MRPKQREHGLTKNDQGYSLIEVLIAMAIFSIGILAVGSMQFWNVRNNTTGNIMTQATNLARAQMEVLKNVSDVTALADGAHPDNPVDENGNPGGIFNCSWVVTNPLGGSTTRQVEVSVSWARQGQNRVVLLTSITRGNGT
jgi:prepilin-type N-terminal cleavage/methylation domain-containing protein